MEERRTRAPLSVGEGRLSSNCPKKVIEHI